MGCDKKKEDKSVLDQIRIKAWESNSLDWYASYREYWARVKEEADKRSSKKPKKDKR